MSTEGRNLSAIRISAGGNASNPAILIEGGIHAREWISPAVVLYIIQQLVENATNSYLINNTDWYIVPVNNPDGYEFTHTNVSTMRIVETMITYKYCISNHWQKSHLFRLIQFIIITIQNFVKCFNSYIDTAGYLILSNFVGNFKAIYL